MTILCHDRPDMPGASIAGRQLATVFLNYLASLQRVGRPPARDHLTGLRSSKPAALRTADAGCHPRDFSLDLETRYLDLPGRQATLKPATGNVSPRSNRCSTTCGTTSRWIASHCAGGRKSMRNGSSTAWCATSRNWCIKGLVSRGRNGSGYASDQPGHAGETLPFAVDHENDAKMKNGAGSTRAVLMSGF